MRRLTVEIVLLFFTAMTLCGCQDLVPRDTQSLLVPRFQRSEIFGFVAGLGTTFAAVPDLLAMLSRRSAAGMNPRMAAIMADWKFPLARRPIIGTSPISPSRWA